MMDLPWNSALPLPLSGFIQILVLACAYYYVFRFFRGTRGINVLAGLGLVLAVLVGLTQLFHLDALNWLLRHISVYFVVALLIVFQPEIRRALAELGKQHVFASSADLRGMIEEVVRAACELSRQRVGALIAIQREIGTRSIQETGVGLDAKADAALIASLFYPHTPLHDGGLIISGDRIVAAGCIFPLTQRDEIHKGLGTRHRAALGITEETDAVAVVVSEETGAISVSYRGRLNSGMDEDRLRRFLSALLLKGRPEVSAWRRAREQLDLTLRGIARSESLREQEKPHAE